MSVIETIKARRSMRNFTNQPISKEILETLVDCGRVAPTGHNKQGRYFVVLDERAIINEIGKLATWGKFMIDKAKACILVFCDNQENVTVAEDGAAATENILLAATDSGLASCWVAGYGLKYAPDIEALVHAPANCKLISIIALGYPEGEYPNSPRKKELSEVIKWNSF